MKRIQFLSLTFLFSLICMLVTVDHNLHACINPPPPLPDCPKPECDEPGGVLKWVIDEIDCPNQKAKIRLKNLSSMGDNNGNTCTCALGSSSGIFTGVDSIAFVHADTDDIIAEFTNWQTDNTNTWGNATGFDGGNYNIASFTSQLTNDLPDNAGLEIVIIISLDPDETCTVNNVKALLADIKLGVDEWDTALNQPAGNTQGQGHQSVTQAVEFCNCPAEDVGVERAEMIRLRDALQLDPVEFSSWYHPTKPMSQWKGVKAVGDCYVLKITLRNKEISGTLPPTLNLPHLIKFDLAFNNISGIIPDYDFLQCLEIFNVRDNNLSGDVPPFDGFYALRILRLQNNNLTGNLPTLDDSYGLEIFNARSNCIAGMIPNYNHQYLYWLRLWDNKLTGSIPNFDLPSLRMLNLSKNQLTGSVSDFDLPVLEWLRIQDNCLDDLPDSFTMMPFLSDLKIHKNKFDFDDLEPLITAFNTNGNTPASFRYSPQAKVPVIHDPVIFSLIADAGGTPANNTYRWFRNGAFYDKIVGDPELPITEIGDYYAKVTNSVVVGLTLTTETYQITEIPNQNIQIPTDNGTQKPSVEVVEVFPNPNHGIFTLNTASIEDEIEQMTIFNEVGKLVHHIPQQQTINTIHSIDMSNAPVGIYFIHIQTNKESLTKKVILN